MKITNKRWNGGECPDVVYEKPVEEALDQFMKYELGFGGIVTEITKNKISIRTQVLACTDTTIFEGEESEIAEFAYAVVLFSEARDSAKKWIDDNVYDMLKLMNPRRTDWLSKEYDGVSPLNCKAFGGILYGNITIQMMTAMALGVASEDAQKVKASDLVTVTKLWRTQKELSFLQVAETLGVLS